MSHSPRSARLQVSPRRALLTAGLLAGLCRAAIGAEPVASVEARELRRAIDRATAWVERYQTDPEQVILQEFVFDAWSRHLIATLHPETATRARVGAALDRDLRRVRPVAPTTLVPMTYWALLLRVMQQRGVDTKRHVAATPVEQQLEQLLAGATSTTAYWTAHLLALSGVRTGPRDYFATTWLAEHAGADPTTYQPSVKDCYRVFHEIVPHTDLGTKPTVLTPAQRTFAGPAIARQLAFARAQRETDALAEVLVTAALMNRQSDPEYTAGAAFLLSQQQDDGTFLRPGNPRPVSDPENARHTVLVALWAMLLHART